MEYEYQYKGKCIECNEVIWIDHNDTPVVCSCYQSKLCPDAGACINTTTITDEEFKTALRTELGLSNDTPITLIQL